MQTLDKTTIAPLRATAREWLASWRAELAAFVAEREAAVAEAHKIKDEIKKAAALTLANGIREASIGRHSAIVGALEEIEARAKQIEDHIGHTQD